MWYTASRNRAFGGGIMRKKPATPAVATPDEALPPKPYYMQTTEERLKPKQTEGFMDGYLPGSVVEQSLGSAMEDQHKGPWQEYTPEAFA